MGSDIVILGAGVVGLSSARQLAASGARVTVLDPHEAGGQGSRAAAGVAIPSIRLLDDPEMRAFTVAGRSVLSEDVAALGGPALRRGSGILRPMPDEKARLALEAKAAQVEGWLGRWAPVDEVVAMEPALQGAPIAGAFVQDDGFMVDTEAYLNALLHDVGTRGVQVRLHEAALRIEDSSQGVEIHTARDTLRADWLIVAAGAWSGNLPGLTPLPVKPQRGQMLTVFHPTVRLSRIVSGPTYLAPWRGGQVVVGATEEDVGFASHTTPAGIMHLCAALCRLAPSLREARVVTHWAGLRSHSADGRPLIGRYPGASRTLIASGHGGQGILTGGLTGRAVAELLTSGRSEVAAPFAPERVVAAAGASRS